MQEMKENPCSAEQTRAQVTIQRQYIRATRKSLGHLRNVLSRQTPCYFEKEEKWKITKGKHET